MQNVGFLIGNKCTFQKNAKIEDFFPGEFQTFAFSFCEIFTFPQHENNQNNSAFFNFYENLLEIEGITTLSSRL